MTAGENARASVRLSRACSLCLSDCTLREASTTEAGKLFLFGWLAL